MKELRWVVSSPLRDYCYQREHDGLVQENPLVAAGDTNIYIGSRRRRMEQLIA